eukprot:3354512-Karenia_brevis.AAC.1
MLGADACTILSRASCNSDQFPLFFNMKPARGLRINSALAPALPLPASTVTRMLDRAKFFVSGRRPPLNHK